MWKTNKNNHATGGNGINHREYDLGKVSTAWVKGNITLIVDVVPLSLPRLFCF
jgi:hypothetical protein